MIKIQKYVLDFVPFLMQNYKYKQGAPVLIPHFCRLSQPFRQIFPFWNRYKEMSSL